MKKEWIDRIFYRLNEIHQYNFKSENDIIFFKAIIKSALCDLTGDEIKKGLNSCHFFSLVNPHNMIEFWHRCKCLNYKNREKYERFKS